MLHLAELATLLGQHIWLGLLGPEHEDGVRTATTNSELWKLWYASVLSSDKTGEWLVIALDIRKRLDVMPSAVYDMHDGRPGKVVGATRLFNVDEASRRFEIDHTWYARSVWHIAADAECKLLLLTHASEALHCIATEFCTYWMNHQSRAAIARLGTKQGGVLRSHQCMPDGSFRDTVVFSIIGSEWLTVRRYL